MDNGIYIAASRQLALFRDMETTATNIANLNTTGYQSEHMVFENFLVDDRVGSNMNLANDLATYRNTQQGNIQITENPLDFALTKEGYFTARTPLGDRYTRAGNFKINEESQLVTVEGYPVLDASNQPITLDGNGTSVEVSSNGTIAIDGEQLATIGVVQFENEQMLERAGAKYYRSDATPTQKTDAEIAQGALETSNVQAVTQLTHMMTTSRSVASTAKYIEVMYDLQRRNTTTWTQQR